MKKIIDFGFGLLKNETVKYLIFGGLTTVVSISLYNLFLYVYMDVNEVLRVQMANTLSTIIAILFAFITNKIWVFEYRDFSIKTILNEFSKFTLGRLFSYVVESLLLFVLILFISPFICKIITQIVVVFLNYFISKKAVFTKKP